MDQDRMLRQVEAAQFLGYSVNYFKGLNIPCIGSGRAKRFRLSTLNRWKEENERCPASRSSSASGKAKPTKSIPPKSGLASEKAVRPISEALASLTAEKRKLLPAE